MKKGIISLIILAVIFFAWNYLMHDTKSEETFENISVTKNTVSTKEMFDLCIKMLDGYYNGLENRSTQTCLILFGILGWLLTSETARNSLTKDKAIFWAAIIILSIFMILFYININHFYGKFIRIQELTDKLEYMNKDYYTRYRMPDSVCGIPPKLTYIIPVIVFYVSIVLLLLQLRFGIFSSLFKNKTP